MQISAWPCGVAVATGATADKDAEQRLLPSLPVAPQAAISAAIGYAQKDYNARPIRDGFQLQSPRSGLAAEFTPAACEFSAKARHAWLSRSWVTLIRRSCKPPQLLTLEQF